MKTKTSSGLFLRTAFFALQWHLWYGVFLFVLLSLDDQVIGLFFALGCALFAILVLGLAHLARHPLQALMSKPDIHLTIFRSMLGGFLLFEVILQVVLLVMLFDLGKGEGRSLPFSYVAFVGLPTGAMIAFLIGFIQSFRLKPAEKGSE